MKYRSLTLILFVFLIIVFPAYADQGKVLKVLDGDTFLAEIDGERGIETIEVNLRCSDAPVVNSSFGPESKKFLAQLLGQADLVSYKVQAFCGSDKCVEALAYFPPEKNQPISYINTQIIEAGMARNNDCRGVFAQAEEIAKGKKTGIWSTSNKIVFTEPAKVEATAPAPKKTVAKESVATEQEAPAVIRYDRAERTVTIKSRKISLSRAIETINTVSPSPIKLYLQKEEYVPANMERTHWYDALRYFVEAADLKQVNLDGKIDLYTRLFYYKYVSPYLKIAGNVGVYMNTGSAPRKELAKDDGTTRYVFINDFENSAEVAQQYRETQARTEGSRDKSSGFIQVHEGSSVAPVSSYGTFERSGQKTAAVQVAASEPVKKEVTAPVEKAPVVPPKPKRAPLKPYSGERVAVEEEPVKVAASPVPVAKTAVAAAKPKLAEKTEAAVPVAEKLVAVAEKPAPVPEETAKPAAAKKTGVKVEKPAVAEKPNGQPAVAIEFSLFHAAAIVLIIIVIIIGCIYLTRSAGAKASAAERHVDPDELEEKEDEVSLDIDSQVDKKYEEEIFDEIDHASDPEEVEPDEAVADETPAEESVVETEETQEEESTTETAEPPLETESEDEESASVAVEEPVEHEPQPLSGKEKRVQSEVQDEVSDSDTAGVYNEVEHGPERVPRKICLFEVKCSIDGNSFTGIGLDISAGGLFVDSKEQLDVGKVVELEFKLLEDDEESARCRGAVTWYNRRPEPIKPDYPNGFGVRFVDMDPVTLIRINEYLALDEEDS